MGILGCTYGKAGRKDEAKRMLDQLDDLSKERYVSPYHRALVYFGLGEMDRAFQYFDEAIAERESTLIFIKEMPFTNILFDDPRFPALLQKIGLDE